MGFGPFSSDSASSQETVSVGGSGQYNRRSTVAQGGSVLLGKGTNLNGLNVKGNKGTVSYTTTGVSKDDLKGIVGELVAATPAQIQQASTAPLTPATPSADDTSKKYLTYGLAVAAAIAVGLLARGLFRKA